jgi:hypothetical protein
MRADYADTTPFIRMAQVLCIALEREADASTDPDDKTKAEFAEQQRMSCSHRAAFAHRTNQPDMALSTREELIVSLRRSLGGKEDDQRLGIALNELGVSHLQNNDASKSEECFRQSVAIMESVPGATPNTISMPLIILVLLCGYKTDWKRRPVCLNAHWPIARLHTDPTILSLSPMRFCFISYLDIG